MKVFFGHQSVGRNLLEGVREAAPKDLRVGKIGDTPGPNELLLSEADIGENEKPLTKIAAFERIVTENAAGLNAAMFKFCYIDFSAGTDTKALFDAYVAAHARLHAAHPKILFAHVTTPLTVVQSGPKAWLKKLTGNAPWGYVENQKRAEWNALLRARYAGNEAIFDLADLESRDDAGDPVSYDVSGRAMPMLFAGYTSDGGHLSDKGKTKLAAAFVRFVREITEEH